MTLDGVRIYNEGVGIGHDGEEKIRRIVRTIQTVSPSSDVGMRFLKNGRVYEALLWGRADDRPIGVYNRGPSMSHVLDTLYKQVKKTCLRTRESKPQSIDHGQLDMAG